MSSLLDADQVIKLVADEPNQALRVNIVAAVAAPAAADQVDDAPFVPGANIVNVAGGVFDDAAPDGLDEGDAGAIRMSANRNLYVNLRDAAGNERGVNVSAGNAVLVDGTATTQPISAVALPLPAGSATSALQTTTNTTLNTINGKITAVNTGAVVVSSSALPAGASTSAKQDTANTSLSAIDGKIVAVNTGAVVVASSALPAGAATSAKQDIQSASLSAIDGKIVAVNTGAVVIASGSVTANEVGFISANAPFYNDYTITPITSGAYVELVASTTTTTQEIEIFDSSGFFLYLATGAAAAEVNQIIISPGGNGRVKLKINAGSRVSAKAVATSATAGALSINFYG